MSFTLPNVFRQSKSRLVSKESQKDRQLPSESTSPQRPRTLSIASSHSPYSGPRSTNSLEALGPWPNQPPRAQVVDTDELEANPFFITFQSLPYFHIFLRSALVCIPQAQSIAGLMINKRTIETHAFVPSPFYKGQFQSLNGKVVSIEKGYVTEVAGFKQLRTIRILNEEIHYTQGRKIRVLTIDRPLEGDIKHSEEEGMSLIPAWRNHKLDTEFLASFTVFAEPLKEANAAAHEFSSTYLFLKEYTAYAVEKILHIYSQLLQNLLSCDSLIKEACNSLKEYEHFQELVENYILGLLHPKIWHKFLPPYLGAEDQSMAAICTAYRREIAVLGSYGLSSHLKEMPISYLDAAVLCLRRLDSDDEMTDMVANTEEGSSGMEDGGKEPELATTPLEKLMCLRTSLSLLSAAADKYMQENRLTVFHTSVASDDLILLLACSLTQTHLPRLMSTLFYIRHFHLNQVDRPELSYALVTFIAAIEFLRKDELSVVTPQSNAAMKPHSPYVNSRFNTSWSSLPNHYRSTSLPDRRSPESPSATNLPATPATLPVTKSVHHRKSRSSDLGTFKPSATPSNEDRSRRTPMSPNVTIRPQIVIPNIQEAKPMYSQSLGFDQNRNYSPRQDESEQHADRQLSDGKPMISTTSPTISTSTPLTSSQSMNSFFPETSQQLQQPTSAMKPAKPKLERSLSSLSSRSTPNTRTRSPVMHQPPEIIRVSFDNSISRPGSHSPGGLNRRPVSMYAVSDPNDSELMGDFLSGLQNDSNYVGDRAGRFRQVSGRW